MRRTGKSILSTAVALVALALAATTASAALSVTDEAGGGVCTAVTTSGTTGLSGGCLGHETSEGGIVLRRHVFGVETAIATCNQEFHSRVASNATGYIYEQVLFGAGCTRQACKNGAEAIPWTANAAEGPALEGNEFLTTNFCVEPAGGGTDETCEIDLPFNETDDHRYEIGHATEMASHGISGFRCELEGHWNGETGDTEDGIAETTIEVNHV